MQGVQYNADGIHLEQQEHQEQQTLDDRPKPPFSNTVTLIITLIIVYISIKLKQLYDSTRPPPEVVKKELEDTEKEKKKKRKHAEMIEMMKEQQREARERQEKLAEQKRLREAKVTYEYVEDDEDTGEAEAAVPEWAKVDQSEFEEMFGATAGVKKGEEGRENDPSTDVKPAEKKGGGGKGKAKSPFYCAVCKKGFNNQATFANHEQSSKHKTAVKKAGAKK